jgi:outer membrane biogenesis lipoprotein LolB
MRKILFYLTICFIFGCKSTQTLTSSSSLNPKLKAKQIIKTHNKQRSGFTTLQSRLKIELIEGEKSQIHTVTLRMERNRTIWINAFLNMVRLKITPEKVQMYNKLNRTYFEGDFTLIKDFLGVELNYSHLENLLLGHTIFTYKSSDLKKEPHPKSYTLSPKQQNALFEVLYLINPGHFKLDGQIISQPNQNRKLNVHYHTFQDIEENILPQQMTIKVVENQKETALKMNFKSVSLNQPLRYPFKIPTGYKPIEL